MEKILIEKLYVVLRRLIGLHRKLLDAVRAEKAALLEADLKQTQELLGLKETLLAEIQLVEQERARHARELATLYRSDPADLTMSALILRIQGHDARVADQFRAAQNALAILVKHIAAQNKDNGVLIASALENLETMKRNVLTEREPQAITYSAAGKRIVGTAAGTASAGSGGSRLLSREA